MRKNKKCPQKVVTVAKAVIFLIVYCSRQVSVYYSGAMAAHEKTATKVEMNNKA